MQNNNKFIIKIIGKFDYIIPLAALVGAPLCDKYKKEAIKILANKVTWDEDTIYGAFAREMGVQL